MKKPVSLLVLLAMLLGLAACGAAPAASTPAPENAPAASLPASSRPAAPSQPAEDAPGAPGEEPAVDDPPRVLIAYFSATGNTKTIAGHIQTALGEADLYEIVAETPYTDADLDYNDSASRSSLEMDDPDARPAISGGVEDIAQYEVIFLGYPIWWGQAPRIINTFLEAYDFSGKTIVPFCTSASSGIGSSAVRLGELAGSARWLEGSRFSGSAAADDVADWVNGLALA